MKKGSRKKEQESGMMTVEAVLSLVPFILVILGIISFTNIFMVHNKIQHAIYEAANELSAYTYLYQALGIRDGDGKLQSDIKTDTAELNSFLESIEKARESLAELNADDFQKHGSDAVETGMGFLEDPLSLVRALVYEGIDSVEKAAKNFLISYLAQGLTEKYLDSSFLENGGQSADAYLKAYGVKEGKLDFSNSTLFIDDSLKTIDIVVEYDLEIYFFKLFLKEPTIHVVQRAVVPAWLDGDGGTYNGQDD